MDRLNPRQRSALMAKVRSKNTRPELLIRSLAHRLGYRFRLHVKKLVGSPDLVFPGRRKVIFVNGCFWHGHEGCRSSTLPTTRHDYWKDKITRNVERDQRVLSALSGEGWSALVVWECELKSMDLSKRLVDFLGEVPQLRQRSSEVSLGSSPPRASRPSRPASSDPIVNPEPKARSRS